MPPAFTCIMLLAPEPEMPPHQGMRLLTKMRHYLPCNVNLDSPQVSLANKLYPEPHQPQKIINYLIKYLPVTHAAITQNNFYASALNPTN
jgi:hypothetical protein